MFTKESIKAAHEIADDNTKKVLELMCPDFFPKAVPHAGYTSLKTLQDVYDFNAVIEPGFFDVDVEEREYIMNMWRWRQIVKAINKAFGDPGEKIWKPDWNNSNEYKYYPYCNFKQDDTVPSGFGFSRTGYGCTYSGTNVGSRLCFRSSQLVEYATKQFEDVYKAIMLY